MRLLHTADWHLGRIFHGVHLTDDQAHLLEQVVALARDARVDAVLVAGDIYDRAVPPPEAVKLLDEALSRLVLDLGLPVVLISGNHDSPQRIGFASRLLRPQGLHAVGLAEPEPTPLVLEDRHGPVELCCLPYAEPAAVRELLGTPEIVDHDGAMAARIARIRRGCARRVLIGHCVVVGAEPTESERPLATNPDAGNVALSRFDGFDFVALGHLHRPQAVVEGRVDFAGSLLKYSFSEAEQQKSVSVVEMGPDGRCRVERLPLAPRRDVRRIAGTLEQLLEAAPTEGREDYLMVSLLDRGPVLDAMGRLHAVYPNVLHIERPQLLPPTDAGTAKRPATGALSELDLFAAFFAQVTGEALDDEQARAFAEVVDALHRREREAAP